MIQYRHWTLLLLFLLTTQLYGQEWTRKLAAPNVPNLQWSAGTITGIDVQETNDGGYVMAGLQLFPTGAPRDYPVLIKVDAQGFTVWEKTLGNPPAVALYRDVSLVEKPSGNLLLAAIGADSIYLIELNPQGDSVWRQAFSSYCNVLGGPCSASDINLRATNDGNYIISQGLRLSLGAPFSPPYTQILKVTPTGTLIWEKIYTNIYAGDVQPTFDGGYILAGDSMHIPALQKIDAQGDSVWLQTYSGPNISGIYSVTQGPDSGYVIATEFYGFAGTTPSLHKVGKTGGPFHWSVTMLGTSVGGLTGGVAAVRYDGNGAYIFTGHTNKSHPVLGVQVDVALASRIDLNGAVLQEQTFDNYYTNKGANIRPTSNNGYIMVGSASNSLGSLYLGYLVKMDSVLNKPEHRFQGYIYRDDNLDCNKGSNEAGLANWMLEITKDNQVYYASTDSTGFYSITLDTGTFKIKAIKPNSLWGLCVDSVMVTSNALVNADTLDFGAQALVNCPLMNVDISAPFLRRCSTSVYTINYCNTGTDSAQNAYVDVLLDTTLTYQNSSIPVTIAGLSLYRFNLGTVAAGACGSFTLTVNVSCHSVLGATHCAQANIYPDTNCTMSSPLWDQSNIKVTGTCFGDSIEYIIKNIGIGDMGNSRTYFVTEDHVMLRTGNFNLDAGDSIIVIVQTHGGVYRLEAEQDPNHPYSSYSALGVQMCVPTYFTGNSTTLGILALYAEDDGSPAVSIDCQQNIGSYDPNDKRATPLGYGTSHAIEPNVDLEYHIRFQNTGTDTAFNVILFDTLSTSLNPLTVVPGASSHPYQWELTDNGVLVFRFNNILLPDSSTNEPASNGFVKFKIKQQVDNPIGTVINNRAAIVFDMNAPILTNTTFNTIEEDFIIDDITRIGDPPITAIHAYPNPFKDETTIRVEGAILDVLEVRVVDAVGRVVQQKAAEATDQITIERRDMNTGVYFFQLLGNGQVIGAGKIIAK